MNGDRGLSPDEFLERTAGSVFHKALQLGMLGGEVEGAIAEWEYEAKENADADQLVSLLRPLKAFLDDVSITEDGALTQWRECSRCGGAGTIGRLGDSWFEDPCKGCDGAGRCLAGREMEPDEL